MSRSFLIAVVLATFSNLGFSQTRPVRPLEGMRFPAASKYAGREVQFDRFYPIELVDNGDGIVRDYIGADKIQRRPNTVLVGNFNHAGKRYVVEVPTDSIIKTHVLFNGMGLMKLLRMGHETLVFELDPAKVQIVYFEQPRDGELIPKAVVPKGLEKVPYFTLSTNALGAVGVRKSLLDTALGVSYNLQSVTDVGTVRCGYPVPIISLAETARPRIYKFLTTFRNQRIA